MKSDKVTFTPEQQTKVDELISVAFGKGYRKARTEAAIESSALRAELDELKGKKKSWWRR